MAYSQRPGPGLSFVCCNAARPGAALGQWKEAEIMGENPDTDSLMDIFTQVQVEDNPISALSRDLGDVTMGSLVEEGQRIADQVRPR
jgi:hypothetical protein